MTAPLPRLRSLLFLPATSPQLLAKATERGADALIVDLEDSVAPDRKAEARPLAAQAVQALVARGARVLVRINADPAAAELDLQSLPLASLEAVMLPKVESASDVERIANRIASLGGHAVRVAALIESPAAVLATREIAAHPALCALGFGAEDYAAALGVAPDPVALTWPAQQVLTAAHAYGLQAWGLAASIATVDDTEAFERAVQAARAMGFTGSVCIHPRQVAIVNRGFSPSEAELRWAQRVVEADEQARLSGRGAVLLDGRMIDRPIVERARRWLALDVAGR